MDMGKYQNKEKQFYKCLGKLCYAIANADGHVDRREMEALRNVLDSPDINTYFNKVYTPLILSTFERMNKERQNSEPCFNEFINFKRENEALFSKSLNKIIMLITDKIASSYSGKNKSELIFLAKLDLELKRTTS